MATYLQPYGSGYIAREGDKYQYNVNGKVVGTYDSIDELVKANQSGSDGSQSKQTDTTAASEGDVASTTTAKSSKKSTKRSTKK